MVDQYNNTNTGAIDMKMDWSVLEQKSSFKMLGFSFSKLNWRISIAKTASKLTEASIYSMKFKKIL